MRRTCRLPRMSVEHANHRTHLRSDHEADTSRNGKMRRPGRSSRKPQGASSNHHVDQVIGRSRGVIDRSAMCSRLPAVSNRTGTRRVPGHDDDPRDGSHRNLQAFSKTAPLKFVFSFFIHTSSVAAPIKRYKKGIRLSSPEKPGAKETCLWHSFSNNPQAVTS